MTIMQRVTDGFQNLVANLGTTRDKSAANDYSVVTLNDLDLLNAYRGSAVAKNVVDIPADDSCREWREWNAPEDQISALEAEEKRLGLQGKVNTALKRARLYGGAALFIGTGEADLSKPLDAGRIGKGGIKYLTVLDRRELSALEIERDPAQPRYNMPRAYQLNGTNGAHVEIHPSRLVLFTGEELPDNALIEAAHGWGDSVLQATLESVSRLDATAANIASLVFEAKVDVVKIKDFTANLRDGGSDYEQLMLRRFGLAMTGKGINGSLMLDSEEDYQQKSASFSNLPDVLDRFMQLVSAATGIPQTKLFGMSPAGMNATGESDVRNYYDRVKQFQTLDVEPAMATLDECLIRSSLGNRPADVFFNWRPLWQLSAKERAEVADKLTTASKGAVEADLVAPEPMGKALVNALTEGGAFPGLEAAVDDFYGGRAEREPDIGEMGAGE